MGLPIIELNRQDIVKAMDEGSQRRLGISAVEMVRRYRAGELKDLGAVTDLLGLGSLLTEGDPLFAGSDEAHIPPR